MQTVHLDFCAPPEEKARSIFLSIEPIAPLSEIAADPQFIPEEIERGEFGDVWNKARSSPKL
ncbi:DUF6881 domain-containing protein [Reyranella sp.]|uniref:DUF6881 domain-containing protein n=1 Tax=Reyranella sp. TaxID=1929291 RepID=UPI003BACB242